jgi:hypothetical protein
MAKKSEKTTTKQTEVLVTSVCDGKYEIVGRELSIVSIQAGTFDLANLTEKQCELLIRKKVKWIRATTDPE